MIPERHAPTTYALFRIVFGFLFLSQGLQKLLGWFGGFGGSGQPADMASIYGLAAVIETLCGLVILLGLVTKPAAFIASGEMAVAYFYAHQNQALWPIENNGERAVLFCFAFLYVAARGPGIWAIDNMRRSSAKG
jgi:putative oxidoreductase